MKKILRNLICLMLCFSQLCFVTVYADEPVQVDAPSALLMEMSTGQILYAKNEEEMLPPASVTKIMTMILIFDALEEGKIQLEEEVTVSEFAASMGGSQVFLEPGEKQTVDTMLKCIAVASANDACVAMAEHISGSEEAFVKQMNERAKNLGMQKTTFKNCNGLHAEGHVTTAKDIALMSRELMTTYPQIQDYCMIWMENITHKTAKGSSEFGLTNTNKLVRHYQYATGLKTGSTSQAKFCISATAKKDDIDLIAVIMAATDSKTRNKDAVTLLNYGFASCTKYKDQAPFNLEPVRVSFGVEDTVPIGVKGKFEYVDISGQNLSEMERKVELVEEVEAPVEEGTVVGKVVYSLNGKEIGFQEIYTEKQVQRMNFPQGFLKAIRSFLL